MLYFSRACILSIITGTQGVMQESKTYLSIVLVMIILVMIILVMIILVMMIFIEDHLGDDQLAYDRWIIISREIRISTCLYSLQGTLSIYTPCNQEVYQEMLFLVADTLHPFMESTALLKRMPF